MLDHATSLSHNRREPKEMDGHTPYCSFFTWSPNISEGMIWPFSESKLVKPRFLAWAGPARERLSPATRARVRAETRARYVRGRFRRIPS